MIRAFLFKLLVFLLFSTSLIAQQSTEYEDVFYVKGPNNEHLSKYATFWVDKELKGSLSNAVKALNEGNFERWKINTTLNLGQNPYPLWLHLRVKNMSDEFHHYWWSVYSQADYLFVYEKKPEGWIVTDTIAKAVLKKDRKLPVRFLAKDFEMEYGEEKDILIEIVNPRHLQNAITDFTTPDNNLLWEKNFYWNIGFFLGCFLFIGVISLVIGGILRETVFFQYGLYLFLIVSIMLLQEIMVAVIDVDSLFYFFNRLHSLPLIIISLAVHFEILAYILNIKKYRSKPVILFRKINRGILLYGIIIAILYFVFMEKLHFGQFLYSLIWKISVALAFIVVVNTFAMVVTLMNSRQQLITGIFLGLILLYLNPAGYFINYSGMFNYYRITYPNYFYWIVCAELMILGGVVTWRYRKTITDNYKLIKEKAIQEERALQREVEIQEQERQQIARDLHDDLGTTISAIKLIITNSYDDDKTLVNMINKANTDVRHFFSKLSLEQGKNENIVEIIRTKIAELNRIGNVDLSLITVGDELTLPDYLIQPLSRIAVELLSNVIKHSEATEATIQLLIEKKEVQLIVEDNGIGFDLKEKRGKGMGLENIYSRTNRWNGEVHLSSNHSGTTVIITIPY